MSPLSITILTPSFNRAALIARAVESVLAQGMDDVEHIVIDGGSTDGTLDVLARYPHLRVISEPDQGMYDALNKGLRAAQGGVIGLLNTDDRLPPGSLQAVRRAFAAHPEAQAVAGAVAYAQEGREMRRRPAPPPARFLELAGRNRANFPNGWFLRREAYRRAGEFDPTFRYAADYDLLVRLVLAGVAPVPLDDVVYVYDIHAGSATLSPLDSRDARRAPTLLRAYDELLRVPERYLPRRDLPAALRRGLRASLTRTGYQLAATALYHRRPAEFWRAARRSLRFQPLWPLFCAYYAGRRALQEVFPAIGPLD